MAIPVIVDSTELAQTGADWIAGRARAAVASRGRFDVALAGGSTPRPIYEALAGLDLPWRQLHIFFSDERCVPLTHPDSNYRMARLALFGQVPIPAANIHPMTCTPGPYTAAARYAALLPTPLDLIVLGMGEDLHTASLFPGVDWSKPVGVAVVAIENAPKPPAERLTLTPDAIQAARELLVVVTGAGKAQQVALALTGPERPDRYPIHLARRATWLLDRAAAAQLEESSHA